MADGLNRAADRGDACGLDTEFYGWDWSNGTYFDYDPREISPVGRTRVHVWSVSAPTNEVSPRGYRRAHGAVLSEAALSFGPLLRWLGSDAGKCCHNLASDAHTLANHGVVLGGGRDTLGVARWVWPDRAGLTPSRKPYNLKTLATELLGYDVTTMFEDFMEPNIVETKVVRSRCVCGVEGCRKRKDPHGQEKVTVVDYVERGKKATDLRTIMPGHSLWERFVGYAAQDAMWAAELNDLALSTKKELGYVWS